MSLSVFPHRSFPGWDADGDYPAFPWRSFVRWGIYAAETVGIARYFVFVDWNNNASFIDADEDITEYVIEVTTDAGREGEMDFCKTGKCEIVLDNTDRRFSPENASGALYDNVKPFRQIKIVATYGGASYSLFRGYIKRITPHPTLASKVAYLEAVDGFEILRLSRIITALFEDQLTGALIGEVLDEAGWPVARRTLDAGQDTVPWFWVDDRVLAITPVKQLAESERGLFYFDGAGDAVYEDRHHRMKGAHRVSQWTCDNEMVDLSYDYADESIFNDIRVRAFPRTVAAALVVVWTLNEIPQLLAGEEVTYWASFSDPDTEIPSPCKDVETPAATTDYTANVQEDGGGLDKTAQIGISFTAFAESAKLVITNNDADAVYLTKLQVRAKPLTAYNPVRAREEDATSQDDYYRRVLTVDLELQSSITTAAGYAKYLIRSRKDPVPKVSIQIRNKNSALLTQLLARKISDLVTIQEDESSVNDTFFIEGIKHRIDMTGKRHLCTWMLSRDNLSDWGYWIIGTSKLGTETRLAY